MAHLEAARWGDAETAALEHLRDGFSVEALCVLGEVARVQGRFGDGIEWYKAACALSVTGPAVTGLVQERQQRLDEFTRELLDVMSPVAFERPVSGHVLAVQTSPRPYLGATVASLEAAGLSRWEGPRLMIADGFNRLKVPGFDVRATKEQHGQAQTFFRLLREAAAVPGFQRLTFFEDDVELARDALIYIAQVQSICGITAWYNERPQPVPTDRPVFIRSSTYGFVRNVALTLTAEAVHELLASPHLQNWKKRHEADAIYAFALKEPYGALHFPSLVQHVGDVSTVGGRAGLRAPTFIDDARKMRVK